MDLRSELKARKEKVEKYLENIFDPIIQANLRSAMEHLPNAGGKRLRPICAMLACELAGGRVREVLPFGVALELIHNFTLVHDDIMDEDDLRRGTPTVHTVFSIPTAINAGNGLHSHAFDIVTRSNCSDSTFRRLVREMAVTVRAIGEGQQDDIDFEKRDDVTVEEYFRMIENKTAKIFEMACRGGALISGAGEEAVSALGEFGMNFGISFQLSDDHLDVVSVSDELGKPSKSDLKNNKKTLIIVTAFEKAGSVERKILSRVLGNQSATEEDLDRAAEVLVKLGSVECARMEAERYAKRAKRSLDYFSPSPAKEVLEALADYNITRKF